MQIALNAPQIIWFLYHLVSFLGVFLVLSIKNENNDQPWATHYVFGWLIAMFIELTLLYWGGFFSYGLVQ